ncbi:hypothetical protein H8S90_11580 [Olivibacter sp. SDN3]|uniref:DUF6263 family protein n=1 Tax=Olivibacter sp. SDN3 TaxID=2764720 RepID=UPI0016511F40|nr:DUF6263 family protein [Olivibacter sp. SDN3]QNL52157.1 hypothetical protein H8S90_11580 [Olivibacter sp. SDN3]
MHKIFYSFIFFILISNTNFAKSKAPSDVDGAVQSAVLRMNLKQGLKYLYTTNTSQVISQEIMGNKMNIKQHTTIDYIYEVLKSNTNGLQIKTTYQSISISTDTPEGNISYDSKKQENNDSPFKDIEAIVGKSFTMYVSPEGEVTQVEGMESIINSFAKDDPAQQLLKQQFSDSAFINIMNAALNIYPNKEIDLGESWRKDSSAEMAGLMATDMQNTYTLTDIKGNDAVISLTSILKLSPLSGEGILSNMKINLQGTQKGTINTHITSGLIISSTINQEITGTLSAQGLEIPMNITSEITVTGKEM